MADGRVVEQGYRGDLEREDGPFSQLSRSQSALPDNHFTIEEDDEAEILDDSEDGEVVDPYQAVQGTPKSTHSTPRSVRGTPKSLSTPKIRISDADAEQTTPSRYSALLFPPTGQDLFRATDELREARRISAQFGKPPSRPSSPSPSMRRTSSQQSSELLPAFELDDDFKPPVRPSSNAMTRTTSEMSLAALETAGNTAMQSRKPLGPRIKHRTMNEDDLRKWNWSESAAMQRKNGSDAVVVEFEDETARTRPVLTFSQLARRYWKTIPNKFLFVGGILFSVAAGACTPIFSTFLSALMAHLGTPGNTSIVTLYSLLILLIAFIEGLSGFLKFYFMERCAMGWITHLRRDALSLVVNQDKGFFDDPQNSTTSLSYCIVKDSEDARTFIGTVIGNLVMLVSMLLLGIIWAFAVGWELTLVGVGLAPVFIIAMRFQAVVLNKFEVTNKVKRENVSKRFHQVRFLFFLLFFPFPV
jgi:ATP-binding cassette subfamily B (MDR/TAP) protein 1